MSKIYSVNLLFERTDHNGTHVLMKCGVCRSINADKAKKKMIDAAFSDHVYPSAGWSLMAKEIFEVNDSTIIP